MRPTRGSYSASESYTARFIAVVAMFIFLAAVHARASNSGVTYQGRILKPDGTPLSGALTQFKLQIRTPDSNNCLMYEELQGANLSQSNGAFSITINDGSGTRTDSSGLTLDRIFANRGTFSLNVATCSAGSGSYSPNSTDGRNLVVMFKDETMSTWEPIPAQQINFVPFAFEAKQVQGFTADSLLRVVNGTGDPIGGLAPLSNAQYAALLALSNGSSTAYAATGTLGGASIPSTTSLTSGQVLSWNGTNWIATSVVGGASSVTQTMIQNGAVSTSQIDPAVSINTSGTLGAATVTARDFKIYPLGAGTGYVEMLAPTAIPNGTHYTLTWPLTVGTANQVLTSDGSGNLSWSTPAGTGFSQNGNSFGAAGNVGTNDNYDLNLRTNGATALTVKANGNVGIGTTAPGVNYASTGSVLQNAGLISSTRNGFVGNHFYNGGGVAEWMMYQPAHATDDKLHIAAMTGGTLNDFMNFDLSAQSVTIGQAAPITFSAFYSNSAGWINMPTTGPSGIGSGGAGGNAWIAYVSGTGNYMTDSAPGDIVYRNTTGRMLFSTNSTASVMAIANGKVGIGTTAPSSKLQVAASSGAAGTAPLKFTAGTLMATPEDGAMEYTSGGLYYTIGSTRYVIPTNTAAGNYSNVSTISNATSITMTPGSGNSVIVNQSTVSTSSSSGALIVNGGVGVAGALNTAGNILAGGSITATTNGVIPQLYGSTASGGNIKIDGTSNASAGNVLLASAGGNVGIGTTVPSVPLQIGNYGGFAPAAGTSIFAPGHIEGQDFLVGWGGSIARVATNDTSKPLTFSIGSTEYIRLTQAGKVGIGTTAPNSALHVNGDATISSGSTTMVLSPGNALSGALNPGVTTVGDLIQGPINGHLLFDLLNNDADDAIAFRYSSTNSAAVDRVGFVFKGNGNVGIGTSSPTGLLSVVAATGDARQNITAAAASTTAELNISSNNNAGANATTLQLGAYSPTGYAYLQTYSDTALSFGTQNSAAMSIAKGSSGRGVSIGSYVNVTAPAQGLIVSGNVGIGTSSPNQRLSVNGSIGNSSSISNASTTIDFSTGNLQYTTNSCGTFNLNNLKDGTTYTFAVQGATAALCAFNAFSDTGSTALTVKYPADFGSSTTGKHTLFTFMVMGGYVYVAWNPGY